MTHVTPEKKLYELLHDSTITVLPLPQTDMPQRGAASTAWARNEDAGVEVDF